MTVSQGHSKHVAAHTRRYHNTCAEILACSTSCVSGRSVSPLAELCPVCPCLPPACRLVWHVTTHRAALAHLQSTLWWLPLRTPAPAPSAPRCAAELLHRNKRREGKTQSTKAWRLVVFPFLLPPPASAFLHSASCCFSAVLSFPFPAPTPSSCCPWAWLRAVSGSLRLPPSRQARS